jgi:predicted nucleic acid-binding protein
LYDSREDVIDSFRESTVPLSEAEKEAMCGGRFSSGVQTDEALTRGGSFPAAKRLGQRLRGADSFPQTYEMLRVTAAVFADAVDILERYDDQQLSFTDATSIALCRRHDVDAILSFDDDFDGLVDRHDPADVSG